MPHAFIVMQIGNAVLDEVCHEAMVPAIEACGLDARRVDKHNSGGILKSEIVQFLQSAEIIIADLTNERPNVYLEVGYAMGLDRFRNLILTVRHDHFVDSPEHVRGGPRVHFDLAGYDILPWHPDKLADFRIALEKRIRRRLAIIVPPTLPTASPWDAEWVEEQRAIANAGFADLGRSSFMEVRAALEPPKPTRTQQELNEAARHAQIDTFGWPIAVYMDVEDYRPRPRADGIFASVAPESKESYDYWALRKNCDAYIVGSLFEDQRRPDSIFFDTRIVRVTEALLYLLRLYARLNIDPRTGVRIAVRHAGLSGRRLAVANTNRIMRGERVATDNASETEISGTVASIESELVAHVTAIVAPMLTLFDFFELPSTTYEQLVSGFVSGQIK